MSASSTIEWTEATWNPTTGCKKVSPGCQNCYAERFAERWRGIKGHREHPSFALSINTQNSIIVQISATEP